MRFPAGLADDGNPRYLIAVREHEIEVVPIRPALPALEVLKDNEQARLRTRVDLGRQDILARF